MSGEVELNWSWLAFYFGILMVSTLVSPEDWINAHLALLPVGIATHAHRKSPTGLWHS